MYEWQYFRRTIFKATSELWPNAGTLSCSLFRSLMGFTTYPSIPPLCTNQREVPLLTIETEVNWTQSTKKEVLLWSVRWALRVGTRDFCPALAVLVGPIQIHFTSSKPSTNIFFTSSNTISIYLSPSPSKLGRQSCRVVCLLTHVSGTNLPTLL